MFNKKRNIVTDNEVAKYCTDVEKFVDEYKDYLDKSDTLAYADDTSIAMVNKSLEIMYESIGMLNKELSTVAEINEKLDRIEKNSNK